MYRQVRSCCPGLPRSRGKALVIAVALLTALTTVAMTSELVQLGLRLGVSAHCWLRSAYGRPPFQAGSDLCRRFSGQDGQSWRPPSTFGQGGSACRPKTRCVTLPWQALWRWLGPAVTLLPLSCDHRSIGPGQSHVYAALTFQGYSAAPRPFPRQVRVDQDAQDWI